MTSPRRRVIISIYDDEGNPHYAGGGPVMVRRLAMALRDRYDVRVVSAGTRWRRSEHDSICHLSLPVAGAGPRAGQLLWAALIPLVAVVSRYDLWIESFTPPVSSNLIPLATRRPVIGLAQALSGREMKRRYGTTLPLWLEQRLLTTYQDIVVLNELDRDVVSRCSPKTRVHLIPNSVDVPAPASVGPQSGLHALFIGRIDVRQKGLDLLLEAHKAAGDRALPLVLAGSGVPREEEELRRLLRGHPGEVRWVGHVTGSLKRELLDTAAFVVVASREESFSLLALEAMAHARPVIHFDLPQLSWIPSDSGISVPRFDEAQLALAIQRLSADPRLRQRAGSAGYEFARRSQDQFQDRHRALVAEILASQDFASTSAATRKGTPMDSTTQSRPRPAGVLADLQARVQSQLKQSGIKHTAAVMLDQLKARIALDESHVWYELDLTTRLPDYPLEDRFELCRGTEDDIARFAEIPPVTSYHVRERMRTGADLWYAREGDAVAFFCWTLRHAAPTLASPTGSIPLRPEVVNLEDSTASPEYRRSAVGMGVLSEVARRLRHEGVTSMVTKVAVDNTPARRWVLKLGFVEVGVATVRRRGRRWSRSVVPTPGHESSWLVRALSG
jgi:glycosyltransferase involved in cell wall biosynthesis/GNAT superfamily N-acetyltransferase